MTGPPFCFSCSFFLRLHHVGAMSLSRGVHGSENREATNTTAPRAVAKCFANGPTSGRPACLPDKRSSQRSPVCLFIVVRSSIRQLSLFNRAGSLVDAGGRSRRCPSTSRQIFWDLPISHARAACQHREWIQPSKAYRMIACCANIARFGSPVVGRSAR
ncbi:hypothetical protein IWX90DRAFT_249567 [Phyllosticta citrichinensis]|uniref:Secreted protein n=1 Tax=Phyllosticta citrichinensis TaxID=1130410 RepID=A0ABR1XQY1_9PEZI